MKQSPFERVVVVDGEQKGSAQNQSILAERESQFLRKIKMLEIRIQ
jgi:hypothetical protein